MQYLFDGDLTGSPSALTPNGSFTTTVNYEEDYNAVASQAVTMTGVEGDYFESAYQGVSGNGARTVMAWVKSLEDGTPARTIVSWGADGTAGTDLNLFELTLKGGGIRVQASTSGSVNSDYIKTNNDVVDRGNDTWYHVAVTYPAAGTIADIKMYVNAVEQVVNNSNNGTGVLNTSMSNVRIGQTVGGAGTSAFNGALDDVRIYDSVLTAGQILVAAGLSSAPPVADFSVSNTSPSVGEIITFTDASTESPSSWAWDFSDATAVGDKTAQNPQVAFQTPGTYTVTLTATNAGGSDDEIKTNYITVTGGSGSGDLQLRYNFNSNTNDASSYGRNLIATGSFVPSYEADTGANPSSALTTSGVYEDHLIAGYGGISGNNARTVAAWVKSSDATGREAIINWGVDASGKTFGVMLHANRLRVEAGASNIRSAELNLTDGTWHHIAVTYDSNDGLNLEHCKMYVNGTLVATDVSFSPTTPIDTDAVINFLTIGSAFYGGHKFDGAIDDLRVYSRAISAAEVTTIMGGGTLGTKDVAFGPNELSAFPNAVSDILNIKTSISDTLSISVYNLLGKQVKREISIKQIDMSDLAPGLYVVRVRAGLKVANLKIVKK